MTEAISAARMAVTRFSNASSLPAFAAHLDPKLCGIGNDYAVRKDHCRSIIGMLHTHHHVAITCQVLGLCCVGDRRPAASS